MPEPSATHLGHSRQTQPQRHGPVSPDRTIAPGSRVRLLVDGLAAGKGDDLQTAVAHFDADTYGTYRGWAENIGGKLTFHLIDVVVDAEAFVVPALSRQFEVVDA